MTELSIEQWRSLVEEACPPTYGEVVELLREKELFDGNATATVEDAIEDGPLVENEDLRLSVVETEDEPAEATDETSSERGESDPEQTADQSREYDAEAFQRPATGVYPTAHTDHEQWMVRGADLPPGHREKAPFAPWANPNNGDLECRQEHHDAATTADCPCDPRSRWGEAVHHADFETARNWADKDPRVDGLAFIQTEQDPFAFVDGDDVRCPETGEVIPAFLEVLEQLGVTYTDISQSGSGVHAMYVGELPEGVKEATWQLQEEPWGANDDPPSVEIYDGKHVCLTTGAHVPGTPEDPREWDRDALDTLLEANDELPEQVPDAEARDAIDLSDHEPGATTADETTDDIRDIMAALDRLDARRVAERTIVAEWNDDVATSGSYRAFYPTWGPNSNGRANIVDEDLWQDTGDKGGYGTPVTMALIDLGELRPSNATPKVSGARWMRGVEHLRELGFPIPELEDDRETGEEGSFRPDPTQVTVTVDPQRAWDAAGAVEPGDLDQPLDIDAGDSAWQCPDCGEAIDVVRAVAIETGLVDGCSETLDANYATAYQRAREVYGAPLPEYLTSEDATARYEVVTEAIREAGFWHLDRDALQCEITGEGDAVDGDAVLTLDPTPVDGWRDSESGESVMVFDSGTIYDADTETSIDIVRFVALENGLIDTPTAPLEGADFRRAYQLAWCVYGAPLPRWEQGTPDDYVPLLPPAEALTEDPTADQDRLEAARDEVEDLYLEVVHEDDQPTVLRVLPALGKTTSAIKHADAGPHDDARPTTYLAPRLELMEQARQDAEAYDVDWAPLPVLGSRLTSEARSEGVAFVREHGKDVLRNRWRLVDAVDEEILADPSADTTTFEQQRPICPCAAGEHGEDWALAVGVARELDYTPRDIHERAEGLFGTHLPCQADGPCPYSKGWDRVSDPEDPADLLIGNHQHAHVESVRTQYTELLGGRRVERRPRTVVFDEFPGFGAFKTTFGEAFRDHATWLAGSLRADIEDLQDVIETDLWADDFVRDWLRGEAADLPAIADAIETLRAFATVRQSQQQIDRLLEAAGDALDDVDLAEPLATLATAELERDALHDPYYTVAERLADAEAAASDSDQGLFSWVRDTIDGLHEVLTDDRLDRDPTDLGEHTVGEDLHGLLAKAVRAATRGDETAPALLESAAIALEGGDAGARELAVWADGAYAHRDAHYLLHGLIAPTDGPAEKVATDAWTFDDTDEGTVLKRVTSDRTTTLVDRNHHGAVLHQPPARAAGDGSDAPFIGLDATGRASLWSLLLGEDVRVRDIHDSRRERAAFLREVHGLRVVQIGDEARPYSGSPEGKDLDSDAALLRELAERYEGIHAPRDRDDEAASVRGPACITSKKVEGVLKSREDLAGVVDRWEHFGDVTGMNDLEPYDLAAILGSPHYGHTAVEMVGALAGEEVRPNGHGMALDYGTPVGNAMHKLMREDQLLQAALRFARGDTGALVAIRSAALPPDLPVIGKGHVATTWSETATAIAEACRGHVQDRLTRAEIEAAADLKVSGRHVRRVLGELVEAGYLDRHEGGPGQPHEYEPTGPTPAPAEFDLPAGQAPAEPGQDPSKVTYTADVRVTEDSSGLTGGVRRRSRGVPAPSQENAAVAARGPPDSAG